MFYANNEQVKGIFLNGRNYNYLAFGFGKIIPEDRSAEQLNLNLAEKYLNQYRIVFGTVKDGYDNALVSPRFDKPDSNGMFHTPFTYYYNGNIVPTKEVNVLITNGEFALSNALVYSDMNINGAVNYFAVNTDFQSHNVNVFPEKDNYQVSPWLYYEMLNNCGNFHLNINTRFSKSGYPTLRDCFNFSGNFKYVGNSDGKYPGFRGFLYGCKDGIFNIDCTNMHGGGSDANIYNYYNFSGIHSCSNINLNIVGSSWQVWPHDHSFSNNCNINTYNVISGFGYINDCNFNVVLPKDSKPEMDSGFEFLNNAENCNYNLYATDVNLFNYRSVGYVPFFGNLNNCNLNLQVNNAVEFGDLFGGYFNNCNIVFDNIKGNLVSNHGWWNLYNCNISGNVEASSSIQGFIEYGFDLNVNLNVSKSSRILPIWGSRNVRGNLVCGDMTYVTYSSYLNLDVSSGGLSLINVEHSLFNLNGTNIYGINLNNCMFEIHNSNDFVVRNASNCNFNMRNSVGTAILDNINNVRFVERGGANYNITNLDNCNKSWIYANTMTGTIENVYNTKVELKDNNPYFGMWRVDNCEITGFPTSAYYTTNCTFNASLPVVAFRNSSYLTWNNVWPHATRRGGDGFHPWYGTKAGLRSVDNFSNCYLNCNNGSLVAYEGSITFNNTNNMQTDIKTFYNETVTANLPAYNMNIKLNVDCSILNLGIFQAGPPHGFQNATISANTIYAKGDIPSAYIAVNADTRIYCENYCNVCFHPYVSNYNGVLQPVILINNLDHANSSNQVFYGGLTRIGRQSTRTGPTRYILYNGACLFINNAVLNGADVDNSLLFVGSNVTWTNGANVTNGGRIRSAANLTDDDIRFVDRGQLCWNLWDYGPWGSYRLIDFCTGV